MIDAFAEKLSTKIHNTNPERTSSIPILKYGLIIILNFVLTVSLSLIISSITGTVISMLLCLLVFTVIRKISGGHHLNNAIGCILLSTAILTIIPLLPRMNAIIHMVLTISALILFYIFAPANLESQSRIPEKYYNRLKWISLGLVFASFFANNSVVTYAITIQAISLINMNALKSKGGNSNDEQN